MREKMTELIDLYNAMRNQMRIEYHTMFEDGFACREEIRRKAQSHFSTRKKVYDLSQRSIIQPEIATNLIDMLFYDEETKPWLAALLRAYHGDVQIDCINQVEMNHTFYMVNKETHTSYEKIDASSSGLIDLLSDLLFIFHVTTYADEESQRYIKEHFCIGLQLFGSNVLHDDSFVYDFDNFFHDIGSNMTSAKNPMDCIFDPWMLEELIPFAEMMRVYQN